MQNTSSRLLSFFSDFPRAFGSLVSPSACQRAFAEHGPRGGGKPKLDAWQWIMCRVYHELARYGSFSANVKTVTRIDISDSALSQRAQSIGWKIFEVILHSALRPLADAARHAGAFYKGLRLVSIDGTRLQPAQHSGRRSPGREEEVRQGRRRTRLRPPFWSSACRNRPAPAAGSGLRLAGRALRQPSKNWKKTRKAQSKPLIKTIRISNP